MGIRLQFLQLHPTAGSPSSENLIVLGKFARWAGSGRKEIHLNWGLMKWKISAFIIYLSGLQSHFSEQFELEF